MVAWALLSASVCVGADCCEDESRRIGAFVASLTAGDDLSGALCSGLAVFVKAVAVPRGRQGPENAIDVFSR